MAKKQKASNLLVAGFGIGVLIAVIIPVMLVVTGIGFDFVAPQDAEGLEVPVITPSETQQIQVLIQRISELTNDELRDASYCVLVAEDQGIIDICNQLLQDALKRIEALEMEIEAILPPPDLNNTESSIDPPPVQICDEIDCPDLPPIIPPTSIIVLSTSITKIDSNGNAELVEDAFDICTKKRGTTSL